MSTETKYQVMGELLGSPSADIETAEKQAIRIIGMVKGGWTPDEVGNVAFNASPCTRKLFRKPAGKLPPDANEIIASMKAQGMTHKQIGEKLGISKTTSKNRLVKWRKAQKAAELYEPGAVEAAAEAKAAEATIRKYRTVEDLVKSMDRPGAFDSEILVAVKRQFPGIRLTVADIAEMRRMA